LLVHRVFLLEAGAQVSNARPAILFRPDELGKRAAWRREAAKLAERGCPETAALALPDPR